MDLFNFNAINNVDDFKAWVTEAQAQKGFTLPQAFAAGVGLAIDNEIVAVQYPIVNMVGPTNDGTATLLSWVTGRYTNGSGLRSLSRDQLHAIEHVFRVFRDDGKRHENIVVCAVLNEGFRSDRHRMYWDGARPVPVVTFIDDLQAEPADVGDAYLRLHLLSHCKVKPNEFNLNSIFGLLKNLAWTDQGVYLPERVNMAHTDSLMKYSKPIHVYCVDKFPPMLSMVVPEGVRIADGARVRLGAHLAEGTTVMHEGFCNFNAGTLGVSMVEGRISAGVAVGDGSDIGGGASTMGTLSGGGKQVISIGEGCLLGANAGTGISLGNNCVIEAGLYLTAGTKVSMPDGGTVKARKLSGIDNALFRRNSQTSEVEMLPNKGEPTWGGLNTDLHNN